MGPDRFGLSSDPFGRLVLIDAEGRRHVGVEPVRAFPLSDPTRWVSFCDADGTEVARVEDLADLSPGLRSTIDDALALREFVPVIERIVSSRKDTTPTEWVVETDRGRTTFTLDEEEDLRRLDGNRVLVTDAQGLRYLIPDTKALDLGSRRILERYL